MATSSNENLLSEYIALSRKYHDLQEKFAEKSKEQSEKYEERLEKLTEKYAEELRKERDFRIEEARRIGRMESELSQANTDMMRMKQKMSPRGSIEFLEERASSLSQGQGISTEEINGSSSSKKI